MDRDAAVNVALREASTDRISLVRRYEAVRTALKYMVQESVCATDGMVTFAANFMNEFPDWTHTSSTASYGLLHSSIFQALLDNRYQEERTRLCLHRFPR